MKSLLPLLPFLLLLLASTALAAYESPETAPLPSSPFFDESNAPSDFQPREVHQPKHKKDHRRGNEKGSRWDDNQGFIPNEKKCGKYPETYCAGTRFNASLLGKWICGDDRLGPTHLPTHLPLDPLFDIYSRTGALCPGPFITAYWNDSIGQTGWWNYPTNLGYSLNEQGEPIKGNISLPVGTLIDRFGGEGGNFSSPAGAPYMQRALPPSNLDVRVTDYPSFPYNYHLYRVKRSLVVIAGPIAPWFAQPGQGLQYELYSNLSLLVGYGYLERVDPTVLVMAS